jgi:hypothetical protein
VGFPTLKWWRGASIILVQRSSQDSILVQRPIEEIGRVWHYLSLLAAHLLAGLVQQLVDRRHARAEDLPPRAVRPFSGGPLYSAHFRNTEYICTNGYSGMKKGGMHKNQFTFYG